MSIEREGEREPKRRLMAICFHTSSPLSLPDLLAHFPPSSSGPQASLINSISCPKSLPFFLPFFSPVSFSLSLFLFLPIVICCPLFVSLIKGKKRMWMRGKTFQKLGSQTHRHPHTMRTSDFTCLSPGLAAGFSGGLASLCATQLCNLTLRFNLLLLVLWLWVCVCVKLLFHPPIQKKPSPITIESLSLSLFVGGPLFFSSLSPSRPALPGSHV